MNRKIFSKLFIAILLVATMVTPAMAQGPGGTIRVIIETAGSYEGLLSQVEALGGNVYAQFHHIDAFAVEIPADRLGAIQALPGITRLTADRIVELGKPPEGMEPKAYEGTGALEAMALEDLPDTYSSYLLGNTNAEAIWADTGYGAGSTIAVIDTGIDENHVCLDGRVAEGPDFSPDVGTAYEGSTLVTNHYHGTFVAGVSGANCGLLLSAGDPLLDAILAHSPESLIDIGGGDYILFLLGMAPAADFYAVKVFPHTGAGVPTSIIMEGIEHVIDAKLSGMDIDILNMSLGGASLFEGNDPEERLVDVATMNGILVVTSAGNEGPAPDSEGRPGTAITSLAVGAITDPPHTRIYWDYFYGPGQGMLQYPTDERRVANFSSRGPLIDSRIGPDIVSVGVFNFSAFPDNGLGWSSGTSFSAPEVSGGAALLNAWGEANGKDDLPFKMRAALILNTTDVGGDWHVNQQGLGYMNLASAFAAYPATPDDEFVQRFNSALQVNVLFHPGVISDVYVDYITDLQPGRAKEYVFWVTPFTEYIRVDITQVDVPEDPDKAFPNAIEFYIKSAKRGGTPYLIDSANVYDDAYATVHDGWVEYENMFPYDVNNWPMEPGRMKVIVEGDWTNNAPVSAKIKITSKSHIVLAPDHGAQLTIHDGQSLVVPVEVPEDKSQWVVDLWWLHNWALYPTNDLDLLLFQPDFSLYPDLSGATLNSPERLVVDNPTPGTWYVVVDGYTVYTGEDMAFLGWEFIK